MILELFLLLFVFLAYAYFKDRKPSTLPPGPAEIPFVGKPLVLTCDLLEKFRETYGDMFTTRMGAVRMVTICDYDLAKEAMASPVCEDRSPLFKMFTIHPNEEGGLVSSNGLQWVHDRRFILRHLRDLGMGKTHLEVAIQEEARELVKHIKSLGEKPSGYPKGFRTAVLNVLWQLVTNKRYDLDSAEVDKIFNAYESLKKQMRMFVFMLEFFPNLKRMIPDFVMNRYSNPTGLASFRSEMRNIIDELITEHQSTLDVANPRDLLDDYLIESNKSANDPKSLFRIPVLQQIVSDLFSAGSDTVTNMLCWVAFYMVKYPEVAKKCQQEIDREVARDQPVSMSDKPKLPYVEAFTAEALRHSSLIPRSLSRQTTQDFKLGGYLLPKGTVVQISSYSIHHDAKFWKDPQNFRPERFLDVEGKFQSKLGRTSAFGLGRRQCLGEPLARMEFFIFCSTILQNFSIELPPDAILKEEIRYSAGTRLPVEQQFVYKIRTR